MSPSTGGRDAVVPPGEVKSGNFTDPPSHQFLRRAFLLAGAALMASMGGGDPTGRAWRSDDACFRGGERERLRDDSERDRRGALMTMSATGWTVVPVTRLFTFRVSAVAGVVPRFPTIVTTLGFLTGISVNNFILPAL